MSVTRSPHLNARRQEEEADAKRVAQIVGGLLALVAFAFVGSLIVMVR